MKGLVLIFTGCGIGGWPHKIGDMYWDTVDLEASGAIMTLEEVRKRKERHGNGKWCYSRKEWRKNLEKAAGVLCPEDSR